MTDPQPCWKRPVDVRAPPAKAIQIITLLPARSLTDQAPAKRRPAGLIVKDFLKMEKKAPRILVIGATGLLVGPVAIRLRQSGYAVRLMVRDLKKARQRFEDDFEVVAGDIENLGSLERAMDDCFGVHINLSGEVEQLGVENVASTAAELKIGRITYISGTSVARENTWVPLISRKYSAEKAIRDSNVPYSIFCPTWFMEVLPKYIRGNRAFVFGKQPNPCHLIAADDYAGMVAAA